MIIPEIILQRVLRAGIQAIRKDPRILDSMFRQSDRVWRDNLKNFILNNSIDMNFNYPSNSTPKLPAIIIMLRGESEGNTFLGDNMGEYPNYDIPDAELTIDTLGGHAASVTTLQGLPKLVIGALPVTRSYLDANDTYKVVLTDVDDSLADYYETFAGVSNFPGMTAYVVAGRGAGQTAQVTGVSNNVLDLSTSFDPNLDSSSVIDLRLTNDPERSIGEPPRVHESGNSDLVRLGANFEAQYQMEFLTGTSDETIFLYAVVKAILFSQKMFMESQGLMALKISGAELGPRSEYVPTEAFMRVMTLSFTYAFSFLEERTDTFEHININLAVRDAFTSVCEKIDLNIKI